jgi:hypothetical protein
MTKVFIDTNRFLELYRTDKNSIEIFQEIANLRPNLISCEQGYHEFIRNRDRVLKETLENILKNKMDFYTTAFTRQLPEFPDLERLQKEYKVVHKKFVDSARNILTYPQNDPIFTEFVNLYNQDEIKKYRISDKIIDDAYKRKLCGNPPGTASKTIGDEIIWETLLTYVYDDLIIVTGDGTFRENFLFLKREFSEKKGKKLIIHEKISDAFIGIGKTPSSTINEYDAEEEQRRARLKTLRNELLKANQYRFCARCGVMGTNLEVHHILPLSEGGSDTIDNILLLCPDCHRREHLSLAKND